MFPCVEGEKITCFCGEQSEGSQETIAMTQQSGPEVLINWGLLETLIEAHMERLCHQGMPGPRVRGANLSVFQDRISRDK